MRSEQRGSTGELVRLFFLRFFQNDVLQSDGEASTTIVRALAIVAVPGLMVAFFLQMQYPQRDAWGRLEDLYFFVLLSFVVMAGVALFEWEMLFPERLDFLVLTPLPLRARQLLMAKGAALVGFLGLFLVGANALGTVMLPLVMENGHFWRSVLTQVAAVGLAGIFASLTILGVGGLLLCVLPLRVFRRVSPVLQMFAVVGLGLLVAHYVRFGGLLEMSLRQPGAMERSVPTFWFLGVYDCLLHGATAQPFAGPMARMGLQATLVAAALVVLTYPLAWARMRRMSVEGAEGGASEPAAWWTAVSRRVVRAPAESAGFHFIGQTMARNSRYGVYLAMYGGTGVALAISCGTTVAVSRGAVRVELSALGLHAVLPLLLFWTVAGLRMAFAFPLNLPARWVFRCTGAEMEACARATRRWALGCGVAVMTLVLGLLGAAGWSGRRLLVQAVCGVCLAVVLVDGFFFAQTGAPFTRPRTPGKTSLPAMLTLYVGVLPPFLFGMVDAEQSLERGWGRMLVPIALVLVLHPLVRLLRDRFLSLEEEQEDGGGGDFQLLGLSGNLRG